MIRRRVSESTTGTERSTDSSRFSRWQPTQPKGLAAQRDGRRRRARRPGGTALRDGSYLHHFPCLPQKYHHTGAESSTGACNGPDQTSLNANSAKLQITSFGTGFVAVSKKGKRYNPTGGKSRYSRRRLLTASPNRRPRVSRRLQQGGVMSHSAHNCCLEDFTYRAPC